MSKNQDLHVEEGIKIPDVLPILPLKDTLLFPYIILPLSITNEEGIQAVDRALAGDRLLMLVAQKDSTVDVAREEDLYQLGTVASIMRMLKLPDGRIRILVQGLSRAEVEHVGQTEPFLLAKIRSVEESPSEDVSLAVEALMRSVKENLERSAGLGKNISPEVMVIAANLKDPGRLADLAASNLDLEVPEAQLLLETEDPLERLQKTSELLAREIQVLTMQQKISSQARGEMDRSQRDYFLRQQLKAIQDELGEGDELAEEVQTYRRLAEDKGLSEEALEELERQIRRLERSHPESAETSILRTYLDWLTTLPWRTYSEDNLDLTHAREVLDEDHYDLEKIKERILEYLAVRKLKADAKGPILCFVGPPGVGKTSLGRSIARALGREFYRLSLGGVRDEAEIRGHRRTYVGALPGRILQGLRQAGTSNPVFMLDEIDKIGSDFRGDPSSALLEVLDPEQNESFSDHYLGVPYDLSKVMFITTANLLDPIQPAFLDRMEVIRLTGYTPEEKLVIARRHLIPKQMERNGLGTGDLRFTDGAVRKVIADYTREAGLRNLERELAAICRKVAVQVASTQDAAGTDATGPDTSSPDTSSPDTAASKAPEPRPAKERRETRVIDAGRVTALLGAPKHHSEELLDRDRVGVATGLAWTAAGGDLMFIEVVAVPGKGRLLLTGQLGEVMKESGQAAISFARAWAKQNGVAGDYFSSHDIHVHAPAGSIPKDGPSAGITIATAIISVLANRPVHRRVAMTGEITLRGEILPIGGLKEKVMAAKLAGVEAVILPRLNRRDLDEVPVVIKKNLAFHPVDDMIEVLTIALHDAAPKAAKAVREGEVPAAPVGRGA